jgi:soluble lytic murein transglycosylase-like protein
MSQQDEPPTPQSNWPDKHTIIFWILVAFFLTLARMTYPEQATATKPAEWNEPSSIRQILTIAGNNANLPRGLSHIIAYHESRFNPLAQSKYVSGYRSRGLMQIYFKYQLAIVSRHSSMSPRHFIWSNPEHSAIVGCNYLSYLIDRFGGSIYLGVLAYNWGEGNVERMTSVDQIPADCKKYAESVLKMLDSWEEWW